MGRVSNLLLIGVTLLAVSGIWRLYQIRTLSFFGNYSSSSQDQNSNNPIRIIIPSLNIDLEVEEAQIAKGLWQISKTGASHLTDSADPGVEGNVVIYAHNQKNLFGPLLWIKEDALVEVFDEAGGSHLYQVVTIKTVTPKDISYVLPKNEELLTLYTCTGLADSKRFIVQAKPK